MKAADVVANKAAFAGSSKAQDYPDAEGIGRKTGKIKFVPSILEVFILGLAA